MFNVRPPFPWLFVSPEDERQPIGFNVEPPLLSGFIQAAAQAYHPSFSAGLRPELPSAQWPESPIETPQPLPDAQDYEIQIPPFPGGTVVDDDTLPAPFPPPTSEAPPRGEDDEASPDDSVGPGPAPSTPIPSPPPAPSPPVPWNDWLAEALDRIAQIHGFPERQQPQAPAPQVPPPIPQSWPISETWSDSRTTAGEAFPRVGGVDPRYILKVSNPPGSGEPPNQPPDDSWRAKPGSSPPRGHNGPSGPPPNDLSEVERIEASPPTRPRQKPPQPRVPFPSWPSLFVELLRHLPMEKAVELLWQWEYESQFDQHIERIGPTVRIRGQESPDVTDLVPGLRRRLDVPLSDKLPEPRVPESYSPKTTNQTKGAIGEYLLANRAVERIPGEKVIYYGIPGGMNGADIISVGRDGTISVWDSKWRGSVRSITELMRGYQDDEAVKALVQQVRRLVMEAAKRGELEGVDVMKAVKNASDGTFFINTIGTGAADGGVVQQIVNGVPGSIRRIPK